MKPLFKYTGGKYKEYKFIKDKMPLSINNYYEPFVGGGGILFRLNEENKINGKNYISDISKSLIDFYNCVGLSEFKLQLDALNTAWNAIGDFAKSMANMYGKKFFEIILKNEEQKNDETNPKKKKKKKTPKVEFVDQEMLLMIEKQVSLIEYNFHNFDLVGKIVESLNDKTNRFKSKNIKEDETDVPFNAITTSIHQAFYFVIRDMYNDWNNNGHENDYSIEERSAHWFFIREYCFGSMFRYDRNGNFNIPYGGFGYNDKCFSCKIDNIFSEDAKFIENNTIATCNDFERFLTFFKYEKDDFIFLDPPYDSTFSDYDGNSFSKEDHIRLANVLKNIPCKWMMAIGKTDFIYSLYKDNCFIEEYDKTYMYQARGKYDNKRTTHLLITNY